jgi:hypothetical protein
MPLPKCAPWEIQKALIANTNFAVPLPQAITSRPRPLVLLTQWTDVSKYPSLDILSLTVITIGL